MRRIELGGGLTSLAANSVTNAVIEIHDGKLVLRHWLIQFLPDDGSEPWREFHNVADLSLIYRHDTFAEFVHTWAQGKMTLDDVKALFHNDADLLEPIRRAEVAA
jgi:hypothetical protein